MSSSKLVARRKGRMAKPGVESLLDNPQMRMICTQMLLKFPMSAKMMHSSSFNTGAFCKIQELRSKSSDFW